MLLNDGSLSLALARLLAARLTALSRRFLLRGGDASTAGLSRETISRTFTQLRERGMVIGDPQGMRIVDLQCLRKRGLLA